MSSTQSRTLTAQEKEAGIREMWEKWVSTPVSIIFRNSKKFKSEAMDDIADDIFRELAPIITIEIQKQVIETHYREFLKGLHAGAYDNVRGYFNSSPNFESSYPKFPCSRKDCNWEMEGYALGFEEPSLFKGKKINDPIVREVVMRAIIKQEEDDVSENVIGLKLRNLWATINPVNLVKMTIKMVKKYGWKIGVGLALVQAVETFVIPALVSALGYPQLAVPASQLPITEIVLPIVASKLGIQIGEAPLVTENIDEFLKEQGTVRLSRRVTQKYQQRKGFH